MLYDSPGDDTFYADPLEASLYKAGQYYNRARLFDAVHAYATAGGVDTALLSGSSGNDELHADPVQAALFRTGDYYRRAKFFEKVYADARGGDDDRAYLLDSPEADLLQAEGNWARLSCGLSGEAVNYLFEAKAFDRVHARASTSSDTKSVAGTAALDFLLELEGPWEDL